MRLLPSTAWKLDPLCLPAKTASTLVDWTPAAARLKCRGTQGAQNATVAGNGEQIEALHIVASPVALRVLAGKRFLTRVKSFDIRTRIYTSAWNETRCGAG
jgi:hypothetical protein